MRKQEARELKQQGREDLKGSKYDWLHLPENVAPSRRQDFQALRKSDLKTARAYAIKEHFRRFWYYCYPANALKFFKQWYAWAVENEGTGYRKA